MGNCDQWQNVPSFLLTNSYTNVRMSGAMHAKAKRKGMIKKKIRKEKGVSYSNRRSGVFVIKKGSFQYQVDSDSDCTPVDRTSSTTAKKPTAAYFWGVVINRINKTDQGKTIGRAQLRDKENGEMIRASS